jgi:hypothetical protein
MARRELLLRESRLNAGLQHHDMPSAVLSLNAITAPIAETLFFVYQNGIRRSLRLHVAATHTQLLIPALT